MWAGVAAVWALIAGVAEVQGAVAERPEGWAACSSVDRGDDYELSGGGEGTMIVLRSDGGDMRGAILDAVKSYDVVVLDGSKGDFTVSSSMWFESLRGRTVLGVNGARLRTAFEVSDEMRQLLDSLNVKNKSSNPDAGLGGVLSNGMYVNEECELTIRQALIDRYGDDREEYRNSGVFSFSGCSNIVVRNVEFVGPGSVDVGGADLLTLIGCDHVWVDHCRFTDGMDGNMDITGNSDFVTVSDCRFGYTERSYNHQLSNLTSGSAMTDGTAQKCNISWIRCYWDAGCTGRMPVASFGIHHLLNCYWDSGRGTCVSAGRNARVLIEGCVFSADVKRALAADGGLWEWRESEWRGNGAPESTARVNVPYSYSVEPVPAVAYIAKGAGPTAEIAMTRGLTASARVIDLGKIYADNCGEAVFSVVAFGSGAAGNVTVTAPEGVTLSTARDGDYVKSLAVEAEDESLLQATVYVRAVFDRGGEVAAPIVVTGGDETIEVEVRADVVMPEGAGRAVTLAWPLDKGPAGGTDAVAGEPESFARAAYSLGPKMAVHSGMNAGGEAFTLFNATEAMGKSVDEECCIVFEVTTAPGCTFVPRRLRLNMARVGTDMCRVDIESERPGEAPRSLVRGFQPVRTSTAPRYSKVDVALGNAGVGETLLIKVKLYDMMANKQLALGDVVIEGDVHGTAAGVDAVAVDVRPGAAEYYDLAGRRVLNPQRGRLYVERVAGGGPGRVVIY